MFLRSTVKLETLHDLFVDELKLVYDAERQIIDAMPRMIEAASSDELKGKLRLHRDQTRGQLDRLEDVFDVLDVDPKGEHCDAVAGMLKDADRLMRAEGNSSVKDAALISAAQKVEHYEITSYGTLRTFARTLGYADIADKLQVTLEQESGTDQMLTDFATRSANVRPPQT